MSIRVPSRYIQELKHSQAHDAGMGARKESWRAGNHDTTHEPGDKRFFFDFDHVAEAMIGLAIHRGAAAFIQSWRCSLPSQMSSACRIASI